MPIDISLQLVGFSYSTSLPLLESEDPFVLFLTSFLISTA